MSGIVNKLTHNIQGAFNWIVDYDYFLYSRCIRKNVFESFDEASDYKNITTFSRPVSIYRCKYCGGYHIGSNLSTGDPHVYFSNNKFILDSTYKSQRDAFERGRELQIKGVKYRIRTYNKPLNQTGTYYVYKKCD